MEKMKEFKRLKMLGFFVGVIALSMATNLTTNYLANKSENNHESQSVQVPATYAKFANASNAMETDFTVAAELSIHAVVHVKTKTPMKNQMFGGGGMNDPFFEYFFGRVITSYSIHYTKLYEYLCTFIFSNMQ